MTRKGGGGVLRNLTYGSVKQGRNLYGSFGTGVAWKFFEM